LAVEALTMKVEEEKADEKYRRDDANFGDYEY
jgi:hypothetical protein